MRKSMYTLPTALILLLALFGVVSAGDDAGSGGGTVPDGEHTLYLPVVGAESPPCLIKDYGYGYSADKTGKFYHRVYTHIYRYPPGQCDGCDAPTAVMQFEIYANEGSQMLIRKGEASPGPFDTLMASWPPSGDLREQGLYYLRVKVKCYNFSTTWTSLGEFEAFREGFQVFSP